MPELRPDEPGLFSVRRILQDWIVQADQALGRKRVTDANVHDARKQLKKARSALRLLRDAIGDAVYRRANAAMRDVARPLGSARDSKVLFAVLDDLIERYAQATGSLQLDGLRRALRKEQVAAREAMTASLRSRQRRALRAVSANVEGWRMRGEEWQVIGGGLERIYRRGKKAMRAAERSRASEDLHDWRKQVKYLWHQLQILEPLWPSLLGELASQAHKLADHLGDDHDLAVLRQKISSDGGALGPEDRDALLAMLERRSKQLQDKAFKLGARLFEEKPSRFSNRIGSYWQLWRAE